MTLNDQFQDGYRQEATEIDAAWTPAAGDTDFYKLGEDFAGVFTPLWPSIGTVPTFITSKMTPDSYQIGPGVIGGATRVTVLNSAPAWLLFGMVSTSSATGYFVHNFSCHSTGALKSVTWHHEEGNATASKSIYRDDLGCKLVAGAFEWDWINHGSLDFLGTWGGCIERHQSTASKPAVHLTTRPGFHTNTTTEQYSNCITHTWNGVEILPNFFQFAWNNNLDKPTYRSGGSTANGSQSKWPVSIRKILPGTGAWRFHFWCDERDVPNAVVTEAQNNKTLIFKFVKPNDTPKYYQFTLTNSVIEKCTQAHPYASEIQPMIATGVVTTPTIQVVDGIASWS